MPVDFETKEDTLIVIVHSFILVWWVVEWCLKAGLKICYHDLLLAASHFLPDLSYFNIMNAINGHNRAHFRTAPFLRLFMILYLVVKFLFLVVFHTNTCSSSWWETIWATYVVKILGCPLKVLSDFAFCQFFSCKLYKPSLKITTDHKTNSDGSGKGW